MTTAMLSSLRFRLALWLLLPLSLFVALCAALSWRNAANVADYVQDHDLLASAKMLSDRLIWEGNDVQASVPPSALSLFASPDRDRVYLNVQGAGGELLAGTPGFPLPAEPHPEGTDQAQWYDTHFQDQPLRAVVVTRTMHDVDGARAYTIAVGKTTHSRDHMLANLWYPTVAYLLAALGLTVALSALALTLELRPVVRLRQQLAQHDPLHLDLQVDAKVLHTELRPVADTINRFVQQLRAHSEAQRRFIADAAHQLRTPLALQSTQIEYARSAPRQPDEQDALWTSLHASNRRLVDVTNKLLLLAQAEHRDAHTRQETVDLAAVALRCVEQLAALADRQHIDLGLDAPAAGQALVRAEPSLLDALVANLLDNALRYTQQGGRVTVGVRCSAGATGHWVELSVADNGPGIPEAARERVFERFFRVSEDTTSGTGLGLAIVREIAQAFGATVVLGPHPQEAHGLLVTVRFAALPAAAGPVVAAGGDAGG
ncbi:sensor histidine kinase [Acidovorax sp. Root70]|uniref:sensor histidine kinase n=1 Tax=Acidovorax sp. Root70 TaxID=1736590 RepID=UPI0009E69B7A|nr:sensor histidine kinase N-terminal domain-containing protein [Acidovorax sp. Root70]